MAHFTSEYKRAFLRAAWEAAPDGASTLLEYLTAALRGKIRDTSSGRIITGSTSSGTSVSFAIPSSSGLSQQSLAELCEELITLYEDTGLSDEAEVYALMLQLLRRPIDGGDNYNSLRCG